MTLERKQLVDMIPILSNEKALVLKPQYAKLDLGLFWRPFSTDAWTGTFMTTLALLLIFIFIYYFTSQNNHMAKTSDAMMYVFLLI